MGHRPGERKALVQGATMNTVGKILVVLNLLFALVTGGFLVIDFAARSNYRAQSEEHANVAKAAVANAQEMHKTNQNLVAENRKLREALEQQGINKRAEVETLKATIAAVEKQYRDQKEVAERAVLNQEKWLQEAKRLQAEVQFVNGIVEKRQTTIVILQQKLAEADSKVQVQTDIANAALQRSVGLLKQLQEKELALAKLLQGTTSGGPTVSVRSPNYENPPPAYVKGRIMKIHAGDRNLVTVSVGSDAGVKENNTLEVYRLRPRPEYLGRLLIREATPHQAVGRLMPSAVSHSPLQDGDEVSSTLNRP
jgi:hypothetical protein